MAIQEWFRIHQYIRKLKMTPHFGQQRRLRTLLIRITERARSRIRRHERVGPVFETLQKINQMGRMY